MDPIPCETNSDLAWDEYAQQEFPLDDRCWSCYISYKGAGDEWSGSFLWFATWSHMSEFLPRILPAVCADPADPDAAVRIHETLRRHLGAADRTFGEASGITASDITASDITASDITASDIGLTLEPMRLALNSDLDGNVRIDWWGEPHALFEDSDPFSRSLRSWFRGGRNGHARDIAQLMNVWVPQAPARDETLDPTVSEHPLRPEETELFLATLTKYGD
jgi:hypothetical protein